MSSENNFNKKYERFGIIHKGYRYLYKCLVYNPREWIRTDQYERWNCDLADTAYKCKAYIIRDDWNVDEDKIRAYGKHEHALIEAWEPYYGLLYDWQDDNDQYPHLDFDWGDIPDIPEDDCDHFPHPDCVYLDEDDFSINDIPEIPEDNSMHFPLSSS
jgi:hypothetical protein